MSYRYYNMLLPHNTDHLSVRVLSYFFNDLPLLQHVTPVPILPHRGTHVHSHRSSSLFTLILTPNHLPPCSPLHHHHAYIKLTSKITDIARSRITLALRRHVGPPIMHSLPSSFSLAGIAAFMTVYVLDIQLSTNRSNSSNVSALICMCFLYACGSSLDNLRKTV